MKTVATVSMWIGLCVAGYGFVLAARCKDPWAAITSCCVVVCSVQVYKLLTKGK